MSKITDLTWKLAEAPCAEVGCTVWDVEFVKEAGVRVLRLYIDKPEGVSINDCEAVSRAVDPLLDEADPIQESYTFEVSSAGADRVLRLPEHFAAFLGSEVELKLYGPQEGRKAWVGMLEQYENGDVTIAEAGGPRTFLKKDVAQVRLFVRV